MFETGKAYKVKVELAPGQIGFGRATVVDKSGAGHLFVQLKTAKEANQLLPRGARLWFVSDAADNPFNGLWATNVVGAKIVGGRTVMECARPKFEPLVQRRKTSRVSLDCPVRLTREPGQEIKYPLRSFNISRSGIGLETPQKDVPEFAVGTVVEIVIETQLGEIKTSCRVIRTDYNWLANRTAIGLEFVDMTQPAGELLDKLLEQLGWQPRAQRELAEEGAPGLSAWIKSAPRNKKFLKASQVEERESGNGDDPSARKQNQKE